LIAAVVVVFAVLKSGTAIDRRSDTIVISSATAVHNQPMGSAPSGLTAVDQDTSSQGESPDITADSGRDEDNTSNTSPEAVALNDSASVLLADGDARDAIPLLQKAIDLDSAYARAYYNLGVAYHRLHKLGQAISAYERSVEIRPYYYKPVYNLGLLYFTIDDYQGALQWFTRATKIRRSQESAPAHYNLGLVYTRLGKTKQAQNSYREALRLRPGYVEARYNLALLQMEANRYGDAAESFEKAATLGLRKGKLYRNLGVCYSRLDKNDKAIEAYRAATELEPDEASGWFNLAVAQGRIQKDSEAIASYRRAIAVDSQFNEAHFNLALLYTNSEQPDSAIAHYRRATIIEPSYSKAFYNLGLVYSDLGKYDSAAHCYQQVVDLDPENLKALFNLAITYSRLDRLEQAAGTYHALVDQDPINEKGINNLGTVFLKLDEYDSAYVYFNRLVSLTRSAEAYYNRAKAASELDRIDDAKADYRKAIEEKPNYAKAYHNLAILEEKSGNLPEAVTLLKKAIAADTETDSWKSHWKLGQIYVEMGLIDQARKEYAQAAVARPESDKFNREFDALLKQQ
jgi:tetratricopeptide (TPR) repeat protein